MFLGGKIALSERMTGRKSATASNDGAMTVLLKIYLPLIAAIVGMVAGAMLVGYGAGTVGVSIFAVAIVLFVIAVASGARLETRQGPTR
jgi:hypothetical protein